MPRPLPDDILRTVPRFIRLRRWWLLPLLIWTLGSAVYFNLHLAQLREQTTAVALEGARNMFRMVVLTRNWNASHGGIYVPVTEKTQPNPYLKHPKRDITTTDGQALTMVNPAYMTRLIAEMAEIDAGSIFQLTSLNPIRPANQPDAWEADQLRRFEQGLQESWSVEEAGQRRLLRYMAPLKVKESCLACHREQGYQLGDIRGGVSVSQDYAPIEEAVSRHRSNLIVATLATYLGISLLAWLLLEILRRRWLELAGKIDEVQTTQRQLLQAEKLASVGQLAAGVAHEINNPVSFVASNLKTLGSYSRELLALIEKSRQGKLSDSDLASVDFDFMRSDLPELLQESQQGLDRVSRIVKDLKQFSQVDQAEIQDFDLNHGLRSTLTMLSSQLAGKVALSQSLDPELPTIRCRAAQINQVALNLLLNASQAVGENGVISVRTGHTAGEVWFEIRDNGIGMTQEVLNRIFEPFYTTRGIGQGTGLGLSMAHDIVGKHNGSIEVSSQPGQGSCFRVTLPRGDSD